MASQGHIAITVGATTTELVIDPQSYQEVDVVDFAPRAVAGSPAFSELGLYLDVAQDNFGGGFGKWRFTEPRSYAYSGNLVDTRFGYITLMTEPNTELNVNNLGVPTLGEVGKEVFYDSVNDVSIPTFYIKPDNANTSRWYGDAPILGQWNIIRRGNGNALTINPGMLFNGKYLFVPISSGRMKLGYFGKISSITGTGPYTVTLDVPSNFESTDLWAGGLLSVFDRDVSTSHAISASGTNTVTIASNNNLVTGDYVYIDVDTGVASNTPDDFTHLTIFGGHFWAAEKNTNWLHYWSEIDGTDAEGGQNSDLAAIQVGPPGGKIVGMVAFNNQLWIFREDGAWVVGEDKIAYHTLDFHEQTHPDNFSLLQAWNGFLYFNVRNSLYKFRSGLQDITPPPFSDLPPFAQFGYWTGVTIRGNHMFVLARANVAFSDEEDPEDAADFVALLVYDGVGWHKLHSVVQIDDGSTKDANLYSLLLDPYTDKLYIQQAETTGGASAVNGIRVVSFQLQTHSNLPFVDFPTTGNHRLYTSYYDLGMKRIPKSFASLSLEGNFPTNTSVDVQFRVDETTTWTTLGTFDSNLEEIDFPSGTEGRKIQFRFNLKTTSSTVTPLIRASILKVMMRPDVLYGVSCSVIIESNLSTPTRDPLASDANALRAALKSARASVSPITLRDIHGTSANAYLSSLQFFTVNDDQNTAEYEEIARCTFVFV